MIKCPNPDCGYENVDGTQFCEGCGEELPQSHGAAAPAGAPVAAAASHGNMIKCPACDNLNPPDNVVCEVCGTELKPAAAHGAGLPTPAAAVGSAAPNIHPDAVLAPPVVGIVDTPAAAVGPHPAAPDHSGADAASPVVPATPAPDGPGLATPPVAVGQPALDATATPPTSGVPTPGVPTPSATLPGTADALTPGTAPIGPPPDTAPDAGTATTATPIAPDFAATPGNLEPGRVKLVVEQGMTVGSQFVLGDPEILVGREDEDEGIYPDIDLSDQDAGYVHRRHATIRFENGNLLVTHLGGMNKTRINNRPLPDNAPQPVKLGDKIAFGKVVLRVQPN